MACTCIMQLLSLSMDWAILVGDMWLNISTVLVLLLGLVTAPTTVLSMPSATLDHMWLE